MGILRSFSLDSTLLQNPQLQLAEPPSLSKHLKKDGSILGRSVTGLNLVEFRLNIVHWLGRWLAPFECLRWLMRLMLVGVVSRLALAGWRPGERRLGRRWIMMRRRAYVW